MIVMTSFEGTKMFASPARPMKTRGVTKEALRGKSAEFRKVPVEHTFDGCLPEAGAWAESSFDLLLGADVSDETDTVPTELLDELFSPHWVGK